MDETKEKRPVERAPTARAVGPTEKGEDASLLFILPPLLSEASPINKEMNVGTQTKHPK